MATVPIGGAGRRDPADLRPRDVIPIRRALVSVSDKSGLVDLARLLAGNGVEIVSTGSTAATIRDAGIPVTEVAEVTGFPEALDGLDALVQRRLVVAGEDRDALAHDDRAAVDALVDDDDARAGLGRAGGERVAHGVRAGELGQVGGVGVDEVRRERADDTGRQQAHEAGEHDEVGRVLPDAVQQRGAPRLAVGEVAGGDDEGRDAEALRVGETRRIPVGPDGDDARGEAGLVRGREQREQVGAGPGDEHEDREHPPSLPAPSPPLLPPRTQLWPSRGAREGHNCVLGGKSGP